jgi:HTH-type transcriptional regulator/antitoxin HigA
LITIEQKDSAMEKFISVEPFPPGEYLQEELDARGWTQEDLAQILNISRRQIASLLAGKSALTPDVAVALGKAFKQDPKTWMNLQVNYELALAAQKERDTEKRAKIFDKVPVRELKKRCWLPDVDDSNELEEAVCRFLRINSIDKEAHIAIAARKSTNYGYENSAQIAWYMRAWSLAERVHADVYNENNLEMGIDALLKLAANPEDARLIPKTLGDMGIRLVLVQHLAKTKIEGAAFWLDDSSPVIVLSLRFDRIDNLWFNLLHEIVHIKYRHAAVIDTDSEIQDCELPQSELIANSEAAQYLIPTKKMESFISRVKPLYYQTRVIQFAQSLGIHPGIVVGQLHKRGELKPSQLRKLLAPVRTYLIGQTITDGWGNDLWLE